MATEVRTACNYCGKFYTRKSSLTRHTIVCELAHKSKRLRVCDEEEDSDTPTMNQLYKIIQEMAFKQQKMEEKMEEMQKWIDKKKKKLNVLNWLNLHFAPTTNFTDKIKSFLVSEDDILQMSEYNFAIVAVNILKKNLKKQDIEDYAHEGTTTTTTTGSCNDEPIACFAEKSSVFYIYKKESEEMTHWTKMTADDFAYIIRIIHSKLLAEVCSWRDRNSDKIRYNDRMSDLYNKIVLKLMSVDFTQEALLSKIRTPLYSHLKGDLKNMIEYDFEF